MPRYAYRCDHCTAVFEINHGMFFEQRMCIECNSCDTLTKLPNFTIKKKIDTKSSPKVGTIVDEFIEEAKKDLKKQKRNLKEEVFDK